MFWNTTSISTSHFIFVIILLFHLPCDTYSSCPNNCNGHGSCGVAGVCSCFDGWTYAVDCSLRDCPSGLSWSDKAYATDTAHSPSECSDAGLCNRDAGLCDCFAGFEGSACHRSSCPNGCSHSGICMSLADAGLHYGPDYDVMLQNSGGDGLGPVYSNWEKESIGLCVCDWGSFGPDCSLRMCPKADDPVTIGQNNRQILIHLASDGTDFSGSFEISFLGHVIPFDLDSSSITSDSYCQAQFEQADNVGTVSCSVTTGSDTDNSWFTNGYFIKYNVEFTSWPSYPMENNLFSHNGNPSLSDVTCKMTDAVVTGGSNMECKLSDVVAYDTTEYKFCAGRGTCDFSTGLCSCYTTYAGHDCTTTAYSLSATNDEPVLAGTATGVSYTGNVLELESERSASTDFKFMTCEAPANSVVMSIDGAGKIVASELDIGTGGISITDGGIDVTAGGATIAEDGLAVTSSKDTNHVCEITSTSSTFGGQSVLAAYATNTITPTSFNFIEAGESSSNTKFKVRGDGKTTISSGGLEVADGFTLTSGQLMVTSGGGATIDGDTHISDGTLLLETITSTTDTTFTAHAKNDDHVGTVLLAQTDAPSGTSSAEILKVVMNADADFSQPASTIFKVTAEPKTEIVMGGLQVSAGGINIDAGGLYIAAAGQTIAAGGLNVINGGITNSAVTTTAGLLSSAMITAGSGITVTSGHTSTSTITASGKISGTNGLEISGAMTTISSGISVSGSTTTTADITASGLITANSGLTISGATSTEAITASGKISGTNGLEISGAMTTISNGIAVSGATTTATISASGKISGTNGLEISGATTTISNGIAVSGATTTAGITASGLITANNGITISGTTSTSGVITGTNGLQISGAMTTISNGITISGSTATVDISASGLVSGSNGLTISGAVGTFSAGLIVSSGTLTVGSVNSGLITSTGMTCSGVVTANSYVTTSDIRLKKNIEKIDDALEMVLKLNGVKYFWKKDDYPDHNFDERKQLGFLAQDVEKVVPEIVGTDKNGWKSIYYSQVVALIVEAMKSMSNKYDTKIYELTKTYGAKIYELNETIAELTKEIGEISRTSDSKNSVHERKLK